MKNESNTATLPPKPEAVGVVSNRWLCPSDVSQAAMAFGGDMDRVLPKWDEIPKDFQRHHGTKWNKIQSRWFFMGLPEGTDFKPKAGIDANRALRHLATIQRSFEPKHEHKEAAVAWLMSLWFADVVFPA